MRSCNFRTRCYIDIIRLIVQRLTSQPHLLRGRKMSVFDIEKKRYSVRKYLSQKIEEEKLLQILEAGRVAPTGSNFQPQRLVVVQSEEGLRKIAKAANIFNAPMAIIVCCDKNEAWLRPYDKKNTIDIDASIVTDHMMLQATELGIGSLWICYFDPDMIRIEFNLPGNIIPVNILLLGYASGIPLSPERHDKTRKPLSQTVFYETM